MRNVLVMNIIGVFSVSSRLGRLRWLNGTRNGELWLRRKSKREEKTAHCVRVSCARRQMSVGYSLSHDSTGTRSKRRNGESRIYVVSGSRLSEYFGFTDNQLNWPPTGCECLKLGT